MQILWNVQSKKNIIYEFLKMHITPRGGGELFLVPSVRIHADSGRVSWLGTGISASSLR